MPLYEYRCMSCRALTSYMRRADRRNEPAMCPDCKAPARRVISKPQKFEPAVRNPNEILRDKETWK